MRLQTATGMARRGRGGLKCLPISPVYSLCVPHLLVFLVVWDLPSSCLRCFGEVLERVDALPQRGPLKILLLEKNPFSLPAEWILIQQGFWLWSFPLRPAGRRMGKVTLLWLQHRGPKVCPDGPAQVPALGGRARGGTDTRLFEPQLLQGGQLGSAEPALGGLPSKHAGKRAVGLVCPPSSTGRSSLGSSPAFRGHRAFPKPRNPSDFGTGEIA